MGKEGIKGNERLPNALFQETARKTPRLTEQAAFLDGAWLALYSMANASHHTPSTKSLLPADAHMVLIETAEMLEYLGQLA